MAPRLNFFQWGGKQTPQGTPVIVKMENPSFSVVEIGGADAAFKPVEKSRARARLRSAAQVRWLIFMRAHRAAAGAASLLAAAAKRLARADVASEKMGKSKLMLKIIKLFLLASLAALAFEAAARFKGLRYSGGAWLELRRQYIAPFIQYLSMFCVVLFMIQSLDRLLLCLGCFYIKFNKIKPSTVAGGDPFPAHDDYPMVLVQVPMCNEREVYEMSICAVCELDWPKEKLLIQILDDSDDEEIQCMIKNEVLRWREKGVNIIYRHRLTRSGYKAGNLNSAMGCDYVKNYEFVAIFDADFQPAPDFLKLTIPHFKGNPELGLVQTRWAFVNKEENLLTRLQNINLCFHFEVEQQVNGVFFNFFGFNGTGGVWRIKALEDSGGWLDRTTVEDMDIAVRAHLNGWKFIYLNDVTVLCEVPESFEAYRKQQHRWHSGPMHLFRLCLPAVVKSKISIWKKANLILLFFLLRKLILPFYSFTLFCVVLPLTMFVPEAELPMWIICYVPVLMTVLNILPSPKSLPFIAPYLLFENTMSVTKFNAMISGLFQLGSSYEWIVTKKAGRSSSEPDLLAYADRDTKALDELSILVEPQKGKSVKKTNKIYRKELALAFLLLTASVRSLMSAHGLHFYFLLFQGFTFLLVGLDMIGEQLS